MIDEIKALLFFGSRIKGKVLLEIVGVILVFSRVMLFILGF